VSGGGWRGIGKSVIREEQNMKPKIHFESIPQGILDVYGRIGVVGATDGESTAGRETDCESLMLIAGHEFTVYWDELPKPSFISEFMRRLE